MTTESSDFARNLRYLCSYYRSTSAVCRRLGINRQQFNKYVAGISRPSNRNMRRICEFFGVEEFEILSPYPDLKKIIEIKGGPNIDEADNIVLERLGATLEAGQEGLGEYHGFYYSYYYSFSRPGMILKSLIHVFDADGFTAHRRIERLVENDTGRDVSFVYKYLGVVLALRDRLFMIDRETLTGGEISQTVLYPSYKNKIDILTGLTMGTAARTSREPICSRIALEFLGRTVDYTAVLKQCRLYQPGAPEIGSAIEDLIGNDIPNTEFALRALAQ